jgi:hypothetical protein
MLEQLIVKQLDRLGSGWKTISGIGLWLVAAILVQTKMIGPETGNAIQGAAALLFGVGVMHKVAVKKEHTDGDEH